MLAESLLPVHDELMTRRAWAIEDEVDSQCSGVKATLTIAIEAGTHFGAEGNRLVKDIERPLETYLDRVLKPAGHPAVIEQDLPPTCLVVDQHHQPRRQSPRWANEYGRVESLEVGRMNAVIEVDIDVAAVTSCQAPSVLED